MEIKKISSGIIAGSIAITGMIIGIDKSNDVSVSEYKFDNVQEYKTKRDEVFQNIENKIITQGNGKKFLNFGTETIDFKEFSDVYDFVNFEKERCGLEFKDFDFINAFESIKANCKN